MNQRSTSQQEQAAPPPAGDSGLRRDTVRTTAAGMAAFALAFITGPILARVLGADGRGSVAAVVVPTQVLGWILMFGIPPSVAYYARIRDKRRLVMTSWAFVLMVGVPVVAAIWPFVPRLLDGHPDITVTFFRASLIAVLLVLPFEATLEWLRGIGRNTEFNVYRLLQYVLNTVFLITLAIGGWLDLRNALLAALLANTIAWVSTIALNGTWPGRGFRREGFDEQVNYGARYWIGTFSTMVIARFDQVLMVGIVAPADLGLYVVAATAAQVTGPIGLGVSFALLPHLRADSEATAQHRQMTGKAMRWTFAASGSTAVLILVASPIALPLVYGSEFSAAVLPLVLLLPGQVCMDVANVIIAKLAADNRPGTASKGVALGAVTTVLLVIPAVQLAGIRGAAAVTSFSQALVLLYVWRAERRRPVSARGGARPGVESGDEPDEPDEPVGPVDVSGDPTPVTSTDDPLEAYRASIDLESDPFDRYIRFRRVPGDDPAVRCDLTALFGDARAFSRAINALIDELDTADVDRVVGIHGDGFVLAPAVAYRLGAAFVPASVVPVPAGEVLLAEGSDTSLTIPRHSVQAGERVLVLDGVLGAGDTTAAAVRLVERLGATVAGVGFVVELSKLEGRQWVELERSVALVHK